MFSKRYQGWFLLIFIIGNITLLTVKGAAQGNYIENFPVEKFFKNVQVYDITSDNRGLTYFAHSQGIAEFDGLEWRKIEVPQDRIIYTLEVNNEGRIYGAGEGVFGFMLVDERGNTRFNPISGSLQDFDDTILNIHIQGKTTFFVGHETIYKHQQGQVTKIAAGNFVSSGLLGNRLILIDQQRGLLSWERGNMSPIPGGETVRATEMQHLSRREMLLSTRSRGLMLLVYQPRLETFTISQWSSEAGNRFRNATISSLDIIEDQLLVIGSYESGLIISDLNGEIYEIVTNENGLLNNQVYEVYLSSRNILWLGLYEGTALVNLPQKYGWLRLEDKKMTSADSLAFSNQPPEDDSTNAIIRFFTGYWNRLQEWWQREGEAENEENEANIRSGSEFASIVRRVVYTPTDSLIFGGAFTQAKGGVQVLEQSDTLNFEFPHNINAFRFTYATNFYEDLASLEFRVKLEGLNDRWSKWTQNTYREYTNLDWGDYTFRVIAKNAENNISREAAFSFTILPPWYEAPWFYLLQISVLLTALSISGYLNKTGKALKASETIIAIVVLILFKYVYLYVGPLMPATNIAIFQIGISIVFGFSMGYVEKAFHKIIGYLTGYNQIEKGDTEHVIEQDNLEPATQSNDE